MAIEAHRQDEFRDLFERHRRIADILGISDAQCGTPARRNHHGAIDRAGPLAGDRGIQVRMRVPLAPRRRRCEAGASLLRRIAMQQITFELDRDHVELNQLLKLAGLCDSGGAGKAIVASGAVSVDGVVELRKTCKIRAGQTVTVGEHRIEVVTAP